MKYLLPFNESVDLTSIDFKTWFGNMQSLVILK